jgi:hypothetical protein
MLVKNTLPSQSYSNDTKHENSPNVEKLFHSLINEEGDFDISFDEEELKNLTYQEAKELKIKLEDNGYLKNLDTETEGLSPMGAGLLKVITFTYDDEFNKSLFETMKTKENPNVFLDQMIHNIEYTKGNREFPAPNITLEEMQGEYTALSPNEIKAIDINDFLKQIIQAYEKLLTKLPEEYDKEETEESLKDLKTLQNEYKTIDNEKSALLSTMMKVNRPNPLLGKLH